MFENISIIGPGLLGSSIAMAVKERQLAKHIHVWARSESSRRTCSETSWCDSAHENLEASVEISDLIIICVPVDIIIPIFSKILKTLKAEAIVTDVGSVKGAICDAANTLSKGSPIHFIGSHPMAGSEKKGMAYAYPELVNKAPCILTPSPETDTHALKKLLNFWDALGMKTTCMNACSHDALVAKISHLPHILSSTLAASLKDLDSNDFKHAGGGLKDTTRIAGGSPEIWESILLENSNKILKSLEPFETALNQLKTSLEKKDSKVLRKILLEGQAVRKGIEDAQ